MSRTTKVWVLWWTYYDGSGAEIEAVFDNEASANEGLRLARTFCDGMRNVRLTEMPISTFGPAEKIDGEQSDSAST